MAEVLVVVPQEDEYKAIREVLRATGWIAAEEDGLFTITSEQRPPSLSLSVALGYLDSMYNLPSLSKTERLLMRYQPRYAFLIGSACGNPSKVKPLDVVLSVPCVVYVGSGKLVDGRPSEPRFFTYQVGEHMETRLRDFFVYRMERYADWHRRAGQVLKRVAESDLSINAALEPRAVKNGIIASDDYVLEWTSKARAKDYWKSMRGDVHAYDMESAGFAYACSRGGNLHWAVIRGVSDYGLQSKNKPHLEAAVLAATCLESLLRFLFCPGAPAAEGDFDPRTYDWPRLFRLLEDQQRQFSRVYKGRFIKKILTGSKLDVAALAFAISRGAVREYEVPGSPNRSPMAAIRLDKDLNSWLNYYRVVQ